MRGIKKIIPASVKLLYRISRRRYDDMISGNHQRFANEISYPRDFYQMVTIKQVVNLTGSSIHKIHNLSLALIKLNNIIIQPGEIFSFWKLVGNPSQKNGYKKSRSIINGEVEAAIGGGLCQLSGLIYFLALQAGLKITERHAHSIDIYREEERFTPLGSDATVAYGFKDIRFINKYDFPVVLRFHLTNEFLTGDLLAEEKIEPIKIRFKYRQSAMQTEVDTIVEKKGTITIISSSCYKILQR